ncbi:MAG: MBL fold metallo-hydrolase [Chloroflexi bacterium]|nr:MBL fold metallo-hydrolase [Chloroflexota bacterium]
MNIQRLGHAAILVEMAGTRILIDPGSYSSDDAFSVTDLDAIVITHQHPDHADPVRLPGLLEATPDVLVLAEGAAIAALPALAERAVSLRSDDQHQVGGITITGVGGAHAVIHPDLGVATNVGVILSATGEPTLFHPGDAYDPAPDGVDVLALPLSAPWAKLAETVEFCRRVSAATVFPIHDAALTSSGYAIYWRTIESLGGAARSVRVAPDETLSV